MYMGLPPGTPAPGGPPTACPPLLAVELGVGTDEEAGEAIFLFELLNSQEPSTHTHSVVVVASSAQ